MVKGRWCVDDINHNVSDIRYGISGKRVLVSSQSLVPTSPGVSRQVTNDLTPTFSRGDESTRASGVVALPAEKLGVNPCIQFGIR